MIIITRNEKTNMFTSKDICREFGISESTLRNWEKTRGLKFIKTNWLKRYDVQEVDAMFRESNFQYKPDDLDWFHFTYENNVFRNKEAYLSHFYGDVLEKVFKDANNHKWSTDKLENYEFSQIKRGKSPLSHHIVVFSPKKNHRVDGKKVKPIEFEVFCEMIDAKPVGKHKDELFFVFDYVRIEPEFIRSKTDHSAV